MSLKPVALTVFDRAIRINEACPDRQACLVSFGSLCSEASGAADFLALAHAFRAVFITGIPRFTSDKRDEARRFMTMVDIFYEHKVKTQHQYCFLASTARTDGRALFTAIRLEGLRTEQAIRRRRSCRRSQRRGTSSGLFLKTSSPVFTGSEEIFAANRTISRLGEMESTEWRMQCERAHKS